MNLRSKARAGGLIGLGASRVRGLAVETVVNAKVRSGMAGDF